MSSRYSRSQIEDSIATLRAEVERLAHASPPPPGRDQSVRDLKAAIGDLVEHHMGFTSWQSHFSSALRVTVPLIVLIPAGLLVFGLLHAARGKPLPWQNPRFWSPWPLHIIAVLGIFIGIPLWETLRDRSRVRRAHALAVKVRLRTERSQPTA